MSPGVISASIYYRVEVSSGATRVYTAPAHVVVGTADQDLNYIRTRNVNKPGVFDKLTADALTGRYAVQEATTYFDGLGRSVQTVSRQQSPMGYDIVTVQEYDGFGREMNHYLPYVSTCKQWILQTLWSVRTK
ncbi:DUF6443 domain-containing protein [Puia sp. P3]|uniref:DUF6443 domain-containing protein n=1 Tax=Puia sp. P3 TaxID=3423952 RepID=UPI003D66CE80